jgi:hypothetical protein
MVYSLVRVSLRPLGIALGRKGTLLARLDSCCCLTLNA